MKCKYRRKSTYKSGIEHLTNIFTGAIETPRLILRDLQPADFADVHKYLSDPDLMKYQVTGPNTEAETHDFISRKLGDQAATPRLNFDFAIVEKVTGKFVGIGGIYVKNVQSAVGYMNLGFLKEAQKKGYALEALKAQINFGFTHLSLYRIEGTCFEENTACSKLMLLADMKYEGTVRGNIVCKGRRWNTAIHAVLKHESE